MRKNNQIQNTGEIIIYQTSKNEVDIKVRLEKETVWLTQTQISILFDIQRPAITKHLNNIFESGELNKNSVCSILELTATDGKKYQTQFYNLDAIISIGYRVNSKRATQFRIWATKTLKEYLVKGYTVNEKRLLEAKEKFEELKNIITFLQTKSQKELLTGQSQEILNLLSSYAKTLTLLNKYDAGELQDIKGEKTKFILKYEDCWKIIVELKKELIAKKEASDLFGNRKDGSFEGIIKGLYQTFEGKELYATLEDKAAHFLYFTIKDHPFTDGNKRTASFLFVYFLDKTNSLYRENGERKINDNALVALALLVAESDPKEKETMIKIIKNLLTD
ncbi:virulence RhuM family protein [Patescibacteria group bacterium]|nr:virulence RhuM family protein [Patescibacteria group bacterium]